VDQYGSELSLLRSSIDLVLFNNNDGVFKILTVLFVIENNEFHICISTIKNRIIYIYMYILYKFTLFVPVLKLDSEDEK
jgi:hypothetical protein